MKETANDESHALIAVSERQDKPLLAAEQFAARQRLQNTELGQQQAALRLGMKPLKKRLAPINKARREILDEMKPFKVELQVVSTKMRKLIEASDERIATGYADVRLAGTNTLAIQIARKDRWSTC